MLLLRLSPAIPFSVLNYALGLTRVRFADYLAGAIGMLPGTLLYVYSGKLIGDVAALAGGASAPKGPAYWTLIAVGLLATLLVTWLVTRTARRALAQATRGLSREETRRDAARSADPAPRRPQRAAASRRVHPPDWKNPRAGSALQPGGDRGRHGRAGQRGDWRRAWARRRRSSSAT